MRNQETKKAKYSIILNKRLPRRESMHLRWRANGKKLTTELMHKLLTDAGYEITSTKEPTLCLANEYKGIKIKSSEDGYMISPVNPDEYTKLLELIKLDEYYYHRCYLPPKNGLPEDLA